MHARRDQLPSFDARIAAIAGRQYGVATHAQLVALGLGRGAIAHRVKTGRLHRLHVGVYAVGHAAPRPEMRWLAAVLACGGGAVLSHRSASVLWSARAGEGGLPDVTIATRSGRRRRGVAVHRAALEPQDRSVHRGIPVTSPARTLVDLATELDREALLRLVRELQFVRRFDLAAVQEALARRPRQALAGIVEDLVLAESGLEDRLLDICDAHGLPRPRTQTSIAGKRIDFVWRAERVAVETDGWQGHGTRTAFQSDRSVSNRLQLRGYTILRFTDADLRRRPRDVASQIEQALRRGSASSRAHDA